MCRQLGAVIFDSVKYVARGGLKVDGSEPNHDIKAINAATWMVSDATLALPLGLSPF
jgi:hypothetical protein